MKTSVVGLGVAVLGLALLAPGVAQAQPARPIASASVSLERDAAVDDFVALFLAEIARGRLTALGFAPFSVRMSERPAEPEPDAPPSRFACLEDSTCAARLAAEDGSGFLVALELTTDGETMTLRWRLGADSEGEASGDEGALAAALREALDALEVAALPCVLFVDGELAPTLTVDDAPVSAPTFVAPGEHRLRAEAPGRAPYEGALTCEGARLLRLRAR